MGIKWDDVGIVVTALSNEIRLCKSRPVKGGEPDERFVYDMSGDKTEQCVKAVMEYMLGCCRDEKAYAKIFTIPGICRLELTDLKAAASRIRKMRLPTCAEWDVLADAVCENDIIMHWKSIFSWCQDVVSAGASIRAVRGYLSARRWYSHFATYRDVRVGFRPAFNPLDTDTPVPDGTIVTVGTLYMDDQPVKVPTSPTWNGDVADYNPGSKLELRETLDDPAYQVHAIKAGDVLIADRPLVKHISWNDIQEAL